MLCLGTASIRRLYGAAGAAWGKRGAGSAGFVLSVAPFPEPARGWCEVRVAGGRQPAEPACPWTAAPAPLPGSPILIRNRQPEPQAGFAGVAHRLGAQLSAGRGEWGGGSRSGGSSGSLSLLLPSLSVFKSHYMGFCSFGTSSSFPICPGTSGAVTGMLRKQSVDYRDYTNERIQALLVSGGGRRPLLFPSFFQPVAPPSTLLSLCLGIQGLRWG